VEFLWRSKGKFVEYAIYAMQNFNPPLISF
jgi:hypothetical protein